MKPTCPIQEINHVVLNVEQKKQWQLKEKALRLKKKGDVTILEIFLIIREQAQYMYPMYAVLIEEQAIKEVEKIKDICKKTSNILEQFEIVEKKYLLELDEEAFIYDMRDKSLSAIEREAYGAWIDMIFDEVTDLELYETELQDRFVKSILRYHFDVDLELTAFDLDFSTFSYVKVNVRNP